MKNNNVVIDIILVGLIALCMLTLIHVSNNKLNEVLSTNNSIILRENPDKYVDGLLAKELVKYKLDACTMVETYDQDFNVILRIAFNDDYQDRNFSDLKRHESLKQLFNKYPEGHTRMQIGDHEEDVYFRWTETNNSERRLALIYLARPVVKNLWMIPFLCYLILILIFILVVRLYISRQRDRIDYYHKTSINVQNKIFKD